MTGKQQAPVKKPATRKKAATKKPAAKKATSAKTASKKTSNATKKAAPRKKASTATAAKKAAPTKKTTSAAAKKKQQDGKSGKMSRKAIELGKSYVQKKIGGPKGVENYVKKNQKDIDKKLQNAPENIQGVWGSIKKIVAAGGKKCLEFCKKHWKAIVIILCIIIAICILIKYFNGKGQEAVVSSGTAQKAMADVNNGVKEIDGGGDSSTSEDMDADDAEAQREMDELERQGKEAGIDISD